MWACFSTPALLLLTPEGVDTRQGGLCQIVKRPHWQSSSLGIASPPRGVLGRQTVKQVPGGGAQGKHETEALNANTTPTTGKLCDFRQVT